jgi:hypothetical protein
LGPDHGLICGQKPVKLRLPGLGHGNGGIFAQHERRHVASECTPRRVGVADEFGFPGAVELCLPLELQSLTGGVVAGGNESLDLLQIVLCHGDEHAQRVSVIDPGDSQSRDGLPQLVGEGLLKILCVPKFITLDLQSVESGMHCAE